MVGKKGVVGWENSGVVAGRARGFGLALMKCTACQMKIDERSHFTLPHLPLFTTCVFVSLSLGLIHSTRIPQMS